MDFLNKLLNVTNHGKEVKLVLDLEELDNDEEEIGPRKHTHSNIDIEEWGSYWSTWHL